MIIVETSFFTRQVQALLTDEDYRLLQAALVLRPDLGDIIEGSGASEKFAGEPGAEESVAVRE
jgi:hypothetical protein